MAAEVESPEEAKIIDFWNGIAAEKARMRAQYFATCAGHSLKKWLALDFTILFAFLMTQVTTQQERNK